MEISQYYHAKGVRFIKSHPGDVLALIAGHLVRTFMPLRYLKAPEFPGRYKYVQWLALIALYTATLVCVRVGKLPPLNSWFSLILAGVVIVSAAATALYVGRGSRFIYQLSILLIPLVCAELGAKRAQDRSPVAAEHQAIA